MFHTQVQHCQLPAVTTTYYTPQQINLLTFQPKADFLAAELDFDTKHRKSRVTFSSAQANNYH